MFILQVNFIIIRQRDGPLEGQSIYLVIKNAIISD